MDTLSVARESRAFPELSPSCAARVDDVLTALARLNTADGEIARGQLVRATARGEQRTRRVIRQCMILVALTAVQS
jgi:hypothetical protein